MLNSSLNTHLSLQLVPVLLSLLVQLVLSIQRPPAFLGLSLDTLQASLLLVSFVLGNLRLELLLLGALLHFRQLQGLSSVLRTVCAKVSHGQNHHKMHIQGIYTPQKTNQAPNLTL